MRCTSPAVLKEKTTLGQHTGHFFEVPCGQCMACRLEKSRQWAVRLTHESRSHQANCFVTLTYEEEKLIYGNSIRSTIYKPEIQLFIKRLRKNTGATFKYFAVGEYGDSFGRPHYHVLFFGIDFRDLSDIKSDGTFLTKQQAYLEPSWGKGHVQTSSMCWETASYCAKYVTKKLTGQHAQYYVDEGIFPEFALMSNGLGKEHFKKYYKDQPQDYIVINGKKSGLPRYYKEIKFDTPEKLADNKRKFNQYKIEMEEITIEKHEKQKVPYNKAIRNKFQCPTELEIQERLQTNRNIIAQQSIKEDKK